MAYTAAKHEVFSRRYRNFMSSLQGLREEAARLLAIYTNEAVSGAVETFTDTDIATKNEHINVMICCGDLKKFWENAAVGTLDRQVWITPFTQEQ